MMMRFLLVFFNLFFLFSVTFSQVNKQDSLLLLLESESHPNERASYLLQLAKSFYEQSHDEYLNYSKKALAETTHDLFDNDTLKMKVTNNVGCAYSEINEAELANKNFFDAADLAIRVNDQRYLSKLYNNIGLTYGNVQEYDNSIEYHLKSLKIKEERNDSLGISISYTNIGAVYYNIKAYKKAKDFFEKSFNLSMEIGDTEGIAFGYTNIADVLFAEGNPEQALGYYHKYLEMVTDMKFNHSILYGHKKIGEIHVKLNNLQKAIPHIRTAYNMAVEYNYTWELTNICLLYSDLKKQMGDYQEALKYAKEALQYIPNSSSKKKLAKIHQALSDINEILGNTSVALYHLKIHRIEQDSASQKENMKSFAEMEAKYQVQIKETENSHLKQEQVLNEKIITQRTLLAVLSLVSVLFLVVLVYWLYQKKEIKDRLNILLENKVAERTKHLSKLNIKLEQANEELERFFYITSHDLKEPLRSIMSFSNLAKRRIAEKKYDSVSEYLSFVEQGTTQMGTLLQGIIGFLSISKNEKYELILFDKILENTKVELSPILEKTKPDFHFDLQESINRVLFPEPLLLVFKHIIENGLKFNQSETPIVEIGFKENLDRYYFTIKDNGIGISLEYQQQIFQMFKRLHPRDKYSGSGIGLSICRKIIKKLDGNINVKNSRTEGTTFEFWINKSVCSSVTTEEVVLQKV